MVSLLFEVLKHRDRVKFFLLVKIDRFSVRGKRWTSEKDIRVAIGRYTYRSCFRGRSDPEIIHRILPANERYIPAIGRQCHACCIDPFEAANGMAYSTY